MSDEMAIREAFKNRDKTKLAEFLQEANKQRVAILKLFPRAHWSSMSLEEYAIGQGKNENNYCRWLEFLTKELGLLGANPAEKFGIYFHHEHGWTYTDKRFSNEKEAWESLRAGFLEAFRKADSDQVEEIEKIEALRVSPTVLAKTMYIYFPDKLLPIYSRVHIRHFLRKLGNPAGENQLSNVLEPNRILLKALRALPEVYGMHNIEIMRVLYESFDPRKAIDIEDNPFVLSDVHIQKLWQRFKDRMPDFQDFSHPGETFIKDEVSYKQKILKRYASELGNTRVRELIKKGQAKQAMAQLTTITTSNIVSFQSWRTSIGESEEQIAAVLTAFLDVAEKPYEHTSDLKTICDTTEAQGLHTSWDTMSMLLWVMRPSDYFPIKITYYRDLALELGMELPKGRPGPNNFAKVHMFGEAFQDALEPFKPRDWVDVQSFIWVVCPKTYQGNGESMKTDEQIKRNVSENTGVPLLNLIYYGPPGTGKTYSAIRKAVEIVDGNVEGTDQAIKSRFDQLANQSRIGFVTFHQTFSYEDFIEGIRPIMDDTQSGSTPRYECRDGILKKLCIAARAKSKVIGSAGITDMNAIRFWKMSLGNTLNSEDDEIYEYCIKHNQIAIGYGMDKDFSSCSTKQAISELLKNETWKDQSPSYHITAVDMLKHQMKDGDLVIITEGNHKFRAIGRISGDYSFKSEEDYPQTRPVVWLRIFEESQPKERILKEKAFSQQTLYRISSDSIKIDALEELISSKTLEDPGKYVLIIDEINRGNISKIFGEMITLLEEDKREGAKHALSALLPYSQRPFSVPSNLHIFGTMNTTDKSIALVDIALRRRFKFKELMPDYDLIQEPFRDLLYKLNHRITLRKDRDHQIGHSYFMSVTDKPSFNRVFTESVLPLLQEYFFNDWEGIRFVLADDKAGDRGFIRKLKDCESKEARNKWAWFYDTDDDSIDIFTQLSANYASIGS